MLSGRPSSRRLSFSLLVIMFTVSSTFGLVLVLLLSCCSSVPASTTPPWSMVVLHFSADGFKPPCSFNPPSSDCLSFSSEKVREPQLKKIWCHKKQTTAKQHNAFSMFGTAQTFTWIVYMSVFVYVCLYLTFKLLATLDEFLHQSGHLWMCCLVIMGRLKKTTKSCSVPGFTQQLLTSTKVIFSVLYQPYQTRDLRSIV